MNKWLKLNPLLIAALLSFALSMFLSFQDIVNIDGILYLNVAREFLAGRFSEGFALYSWAFYPALIAGLSKITTFSLEHSAFIINASFMALMASGFVALVRTLGGDKIVQWVAVLIFLVHPGINDYREYIMRDFGAWAMLIWSLIFLCQFSEKPSWGNVLGWTFTVLLAILFRPEGVIWLLLGPCVLLFSKRFQAWLKLNSLLMVMGLIGLLVTFFMNIDIPYTKLHGMQNAYIQIFSVGIDRYAEKAQAFSEMMSIYFKFDHAVIVLGVALLFYAVFLTLKLLSVLYTALLGYAVAVRPVIASPQKYVLIWMLILYASIYILFLMQNYFISSRYLIPWVTVAMVWVPFALVKLWPRAPGALKATIGLFLLYMFLDSVLSFGYSKMYLKDAGLWINQNTPVNARLYTDSKQVAYYADRSVVDNPQDADVIALRYNRKSPQALFAPPQADFHNKRKDGVSVVIRH